MRRVLGLVALTLLPCLGTACGLSNRMARHALVPILEGSALAARERDDLETIERALPANLLLLDGLLRTEPDNRELLSLGSYLYFGYALGFVEERDPGLASRYYARGLDYGLRALDRRRAFRRGRNGGLEDFQSGLQSLRRGDRAALVWAAANWGRWISLNLDSPAALVQMPRFEALLDRMLEVDPEYENGLPHALRGVYDALRPEMFGGNPEKAKTHFDEAFRLSERRMLLFLVFYAEFYCRQVLDEECFESTLDEIQAAPVDLLPEERLMNEIGRLRARKLRARREELF